MHESINDHSSDPHGSRRRGICNRLTRVRNEGRMIALLAATATAILIIGRQEFAEMLALLITRFRR